MGEVFYHDLNRLTAKDAMVKHLERNVRKLMIIESSHHEELVVIQNKANEEAMAQCKELGTLRRELNDVKLESLKEKEVLPT